MYLENQILFVSSLGDHRDLHSFLHDALPIFLEQPGRRRREAFERRARQRHDPRAAVAVLAHEVHPDQPALDADPPRDRKSTRLNSSHVEISYAVFCLKKKKKHVARDASTTIP